MGRPNRKRSRPQSPETPKESCQPVVRPLSASHFNAFRISSLLDSKGSTRTTAKGTVRQVWGELSDRDVAAISDLSSPRSIEVDRHSGVAWLLNGRTAPNRTRTDTHDKKATSPPAIDNEDRDIPCRRPSGVEDEMCLCDRFLRDELQRLKLEFEDITPTVFKRVRSACNPAETLSSGPFLNRSAMKLANIDAITRLSSTTSPPCSGASLTDDAEAPKDASAPVNAGSKGIPQKTVEQIAVHAEGGAKSKSGLLFADLCGGPGGFSEYLFRRRRPLGLYTKGFGISLRKGTSAHPDDRDLSAHGCKTSPKQETQASSEEIPFSEYNGRFSNSCSPRTRNNGCGTAFVETVEDQSHAVLSIVGRPATATIDGHSRQQDSCAWRLDRLSPWCNVTVINRIIGSLTFDGAVGDGRSVGVDSNGNQSPICQDVNDVSRSATQHSSTVHASQACTSNQPTDDMRIDYGPDGTGDLTNKANIVGFVENVLASTAGERLDLVVADGGFSAARDVTEQERIVSPLLHCEALTALLLLAEGGSFVCKLFEVWSECTASLVYVLHRKFERVAIIKPITSRPASGERYIVCKGLLSNATECRWVDYLAEEVHALLQYSTSVSDSPAAPATSRPNQRFPVSNSIGFGSGKAVKDVACDMENDRTFISYVRLINDRLASLQTEACIGIVDVASSQRGRAWAFRHSKGRLTVDGDIITRRDREGSETGSDDEGQASSIASFWNDWSLNSIAEQSNSKMLDASLR